MVRFSTVRDIIINMIVLTKSTAEAMVAKIQAMTEKSPCAFCCQRDDADDERIVHLDECEGKDFLATLQDALKDNARSIWDDCK